MGDGTTTQRNVPIQIGTATNWSSVSGGGLFTVGIKADGTLWAWGRNNYGQLGDGTTTNRSIPIQIGTSANWSTIGAGQEHTIGIKTDGTLWTWGRNNHQLGGAITYSTVPTQIGTATNWSSVNVGGSHNIGKKSDGTIWIWGYNLFGQLGNGTNGNTADSNVPTAITCPVLITTDFENESRFSFYPNPVWNILNIDALSNIEKISVYNMLGQEVIFKSYDNQSISLDVSFLQSGMYIIKTNINGVTSTSRFVKE